MISSHWISIHAPIEGCDVRKLEIIVPDDLISIHAPIVGCDLDTDLSEIKKQLFQSTHPSWGATLIKLQLKQIAMHFNPRTHRGVRLSNAQALNSATLFQSTHPSWGATSIGGIFYEKKTAISIHAPIVGCDKGRQKCLLFT